MFRAELGMCGGGSLTPSVGAEGRGMTIVGALAGGGPPASMRDRKLYVLVDIFNNGLLNGIRILFFLCCKFCLSVTDLLGRSSQVLPDVTEKRSKFFG